MSTLDPLNMNIDDVLHFPIKVKIQPPSSSPAPGVHMSFCKGVLEGNEQTFSLTFVLAPRQDRLHILFQRPPGMSDMEYNKKCAEVKSELCEVGTNWHDPSVRTKAQPNQPSESYYKDGKVPMVLHPSTHVVPGLNELSTRIREAVNETCRFWPMVAGDEGVRNRIVSQLKSLIAPSVGGRPSGFKVKLKPNLSGPLDETMTQIIICEPETGLMRPGHVTEITPKSRVIPIGTLNCVVFQPSQGTPSIFCSMMIVFPHTVNNSMNHMSMAIGIDISSRMVHDVVPQQNSYVGEKDDSMMVDDDEPDTHTTVMGEPNWAVGSTVDMETTVADSAFTFN